MFATDVSYARPSSDSRLSPKSPVCQLFNNFDIQWSTPSINFLVLVPSDSFQAQKWPAAQRRVLRRVQLDRCRVNFVEQDPASGNQQPRHPSRIGQVVIDPSKEAILALDCEEDPDR